MYQNVRTIKVGTFNLMNFMLPNKPMYNGTLCYSGDEYRRKSDWVKFMLDQIDADIIGFQELFHKEALLRVIKNNPKYRKAKVYIAEETGDQPSVALLSRYPVEKIEVYKYFPEEAVIDFNPRGGDRIALPFTTFTRPVIKADILIPHYGLITVFVVHLKSKREIYYSGEDPQNPVDLARAQSRSLMLRASESVALRALVSEALEIPDRPVILCGDVNDTGNAVTSRIISGEVPQHRLQDNVKRRIWDLLLYHVKDIQARRSYQDFYYTHIHNGMYESLDHIMVSQELVTEYPRNTGRVGLVSVFNDHLTDQTYTNQGHDKCKSDHGVVVCSLELDLDRAEKYMKNHSDHDCANTMLDEEDILSRLDENTLTPTTEPRLEDNIREQDTNSAPNTPQSDSFNISNSLDRWKKNHPDQEVRPARDRKRRDDRKHNNSRYDRRNVKPLDITDQDYIIDSEDHETSVFEKTNANESPIETRVTHNDIRNANECNTIAPAITMIMQSPAEPESTPSPVTSTETIPAEKPKRRLFRGNRAPIGSPKTTETPSIDLPKSPKPAPAAPEPPQPAVKALAEVPLPQKETPTIACKQLDSGEWPAIPSAPRSFAHRNKTTEQHAEPQLTEREKKHESAASNNSDKQNNHRRRQYPRRGPIGALPNDNIE